MKKIGLLFMFAFCSLGASLVHAVAPSVEGSWLVTFYLENTRATGATQCIVFKTVPGTVAGVATSGVWSSPSFPGWQGQWIQLGDHVRWFGLTSTLATSESGNVENLTRFGGVSFNHYSKTTGATSSAGSWLGARAPNGCRLGIDNTAVGEDPAGR